MIKPICTIAILITMLTWSCKPKKDSMSFSPKKQSSSVFDYFDFNAVPKDSIDSLLAAYIPVTLSADLTGLTPNETKMVPLLIEAARIMDDLFWEQAYGDKQKLLTNIESNNLVAFAMMNYGPWDRLNGNKPFVPGTGPKPLGANFYPKEMIKEELEQTQLEGKDSLYTMIRRDDEDGSLYTIPYHKYFKKQLERASFLLSQAATLADDAALRNYLELRSKALVTDYYQESDMAWLNMKENKLDIVIGPIETYEDQMFGYKAAFSAYVLIKDMEWSRRLSRYAEFLPELQRNLPVAAKYKKEKPGTDTELNAYDAIYYSGDCNSGSKTIAINLPNDEYVQLNKGTRRLQLKNVMKAKFDKILVPIAAELISDNQANNISFDAFFANTMFHEVAHGLGIKNTIDGKNTVRLALQDHASAIEEGKADILGLHMVEHLHKKGEVDGRINDYRVTFMASIFRSIRFGSSSAHGMANLIRFNYFAEQKAFVRNDKTGKYSIHYGKFETAVKALTAEILKLQGDGNYAATERFIRKYGAMPIYLKNDLEKLTLKNIPVDVVFKQGMEHLDFDY